MMSRPATFDPWPCGPAGRRFRTRPVHWLESVRGNPPVEIEAHGERAWSACAQGYLLRSPCHLRATRSGRAGSEHDADVVGAGGFGRERL
jgi:hypothetical protein